MPVQTSQTDSGNNGVPKGSDDNSVNEQSAVPPESQVSSQPSRTKRGSATMKYIAIIIVVLAVLAIVAYFLILKNSSMAVGGAGSYSALDHNQSIFALASVIKQGYSSQQALNASYNGIISMYYSIYHINVPFTLTMQKYGNDSSEHISVPLSGLYTLLGSPSFNSKYNSTLSLFMYYINNTYYLCVPEDSIASFIFVSILYNGKSSYPKYATSPGSPAGCIKANGTSIAQAQNYAIMNVSLLQFSKIFNISVLNYSLVQGTYSGNSCSQFSEKMKSDINFALLSSLSSGSGSTSLSLPSFPVNISTCLSNSYYGMPYSMNISLPDIVIPSSYQPSQQNSMSTTQGTAFSVSLLLNSNYINNEVTQQDVSVLPYPVVNMPSQQAASYLGIVTSPITTIFISLFELGAFNNGSPPNVCVGQPGFVCTLTAITSTGNLNITFGQVSSNTWTSANFMMFNSSMSLSAVGTFSSHPSTSSNEILNLTPGTTVSLNVPEPWFASSSAGTTVSGQLWVQYVVNGTTYYAEVGTITGTLPG